MRLFPYEESAFPGFSHLRGQMNRLFDEFFGDSEFRPLQHEWRPPVDVVELADELEIFVDLPGVDANKIEISVVGDTLTIRGEKPRLLEAEKGTWHRREIGFGKFVRNIPLPISIKPDKIEATNEAGVLRIKLPKREEALAKKIPVKIVKS